MKISWFCYFKPLLLTLLLIFQADALAAHEYHHTHIDANTIDHCQLCAHKHALDNISIGDFNSFITTKACTPRVQVAIVVSLAHCAASKSIRAPPFA
ncbi:hypothetical protein [Paraferrimonas haliotis]|uniref:hypothetical protein n=1 Tax=Paraferrimonas haliotis TaxID=2013866 RepID=UPI000BA8DE18|nr:hypothetical protein [Paraferrimonas haliotis]